MGTDDWAAYAGGIDTGSVTTPEYIGVHEDDILPSPGRVSGEVHLSSRLSFSKGILAGNKDARTQKLKQLLRYVAGAAVIIGLVAIGVKTASVLREVSASQRATDEVKKQLENEITLDQAYLDRASDIEHRTEQKRAQITELGSHVPDESVDETPSRKRKSRIKKLNNIKNAFGSLGKNKRKKRQPLEGSLPPSGDTQQQMRPEVRASSSLAVAISDELQPSQQQMQPAMKDPSSWRAALSDDQLSSRLSDGSGQSSVAGSLRDPFRDVVAAIEDEMKHVEEEEVQWQKKHGSVYKKYKETIGMRNPEKGPHGQMWKMASELQVPGTHADAKQWIESSSRRNSQLAKAFFRRYFFPAATTVLNDREVDAQKGIASEREKLKELEKTTGNRDT
ncbi:hypothetical protein TGME49_215360 [Toxoplasma gondii ME49]|uniref:Transmembrane protein n=2 Tax=Toxoplasma gondii TaxID=5811 RepID=S8EZB6_TOXGM|nr:hypothetical protein TGME49_215360 [Toxoplasma gondii ME49]EPT26458.1 hypothetical protein TGME49_215360 [Toxoplasma gondii ME49]KFG36106.1 putative transmembrane protein [Toxoplasma gondii GAB2-2007-GAL-DOM2]|eukprot:XP_002370855.1 hypothetical protein TGME49_215360 [Toxoplasma gondii ME49]